MRLKELYDVYNKYLHIEDMNRVDVVLATALSSKQKGTPIWLFLVGASGDMKSVQINALKGYNETYPLYNLTSKSLVNGYKDKKKYPDLAPELDNKLIVISDLSQILKLPTIEKGELWGQLRDLYDGYAGKVSGLGSRATYENLFVTLIIGSTPAIDSQILIHQDLGTRELIYRTSGSIESERLMDRCLDNEGYNEIMKKELEEITTKFLNETEIKNIELSKDIIIKLKEIAIYISNMRSTAEFDSYTHELRNFVYPEQPTRIIKQLKRLFICLMNLEQNYEEEKALEILWHIAKSSAFPLRVKIYEYLKENKGIEFSTTQIALKLRIGKATVKRECLVLENVNLIECRTEEDLQGRFTRHWMFQLD